MNADITQSRITFPHTGAFVQALGGDATSAAGAQTCWASADELWGFVSERSRRLFDELVPVPTQRISCRLVTTRTRATAAKACLLEEMHKKGPGTARDRPEPARGQYSMLFTWSHVPLAIWQTDNVAGRRCGRSPDRSSIPGNSRTASSPPKTRSSIWRHGTASSIHKRARCRSICSCRSISASTPQPKRDSSAIVGVTFDQQTQKVRLVFHRIFQPSQIEPLDFELTIEATILEINKRFQIKKILYDPYQMQASAQRLTKEGVPNIEEYPQTLDRLTAMSQQLYDLITGQSCRLSQRSDPNRDQPHRGAGRRTRLAHHQGKAIAQDRRGRRIGDGLLRRCPRPGREFIRPKLALAEWRRADRSQGTGEKGKPTTGIAANLHAYLNAHNAFGRGPPWGRI